MVVIRGYASALTRAHPKTGCILEGVSMSGTSLGAYSRQAQGLQQPAAPVPILSRRNHPLSGTFPTECIVFHLYKRFCIKFQLIYFLHYCPPQVHPSRDSRIEWRRSTGQYNWRACEWEHAAACAGQWGRGPSRPIPGITPGAQEDAAALLSIKHPGASTSLQTRFFANTVKLHPPTTTTTNSKHLAQGMRLCYLSKSGRAC